MTLFGRIDVQGFFDKMSELGRQDRSRYHVTLGELIAALEAAEPSLPADLLDAGHPDSDQARYPGKEDSYRGYYSDLAFESSLEFVNVERFLRQCRRALGSTYVGYKGGDFVMGPETPLWIASYGYASGIAVMGIDHGASGYGFRLVTRDVDPLP